MLQGRARGNAVPAPRAQPTTSRRTVPEALFTQSLPGRQAVDLHDLRHSFASLLLHERRSVIYVARQLGHDARLTLTRYGHVIDELTTNRAYPPRTRSGPLARRSGNS